MWLVATVWYHANIKHFYYYRKFYWTVLVWTLDRALANYYFCLSLGCYDRDHALDGLNELFSHSPGGWEVQGQGASRFSIWWGPSSWFAGSHLLTVSSHDGERRQRSRTGDYGIRPTSCNSLVASTPVQPCCTDQGSWPSSINRNWLEVRQEIQARHYWGPCCSRWERDKTTISLAHLLPQNYFLCCLKRMYP